MFCPRSRTKLVAILSVAALLTFYLAYRAATKELYHPTETDFEKITFGMSEGEVEAILGPPHKVLTWESSKREFYRPPYPGVKVFFYYGREHETGLTNDTFNVKIDTTTGRVCGYGTGSSKEPSLIDKLNQWLKDVFGL